MRWSVGGEVGMTTWSAGRRDRLWLAAPQFQLGYQEASDWGLAASFGAVLLLDDPTGGPAQSTVAASNGWVGAWYQLRPELRLRFGVTAPLSFLGFDALAGQRAAGYSLAAGMRGLWDAWLWAPERAGAQVGLQLAPQQVCPHLWVAAEADAAGTVSVQRFSNRSADGYFQAAAELLLGDQRLRFGLRAQVVMISAEGDGVQTSIAPVVTYGGERVAVRGRWVLNIDRPLGLIGTGLDVSGLILGMEVQI